eukprot:scaffold9627_cov22-Prasinocladus_malaysianus.AAC.1
MRSAIYELCLEPTPFHYGIDFLPEGCGSETLVTKCWAVPCQGSYQVRLNGQDSQRGTFNQRHMVLHDQARTILSAQENERMMTGSKVQTCAIVCSCKTMADFKGVASPKSKIWQ